MKTIQFVVNSHHLDLAFGQIQRKSDVSAFCPIAQAAKETLQEKNIVVGLSSLQVGNELYAMDDIAVMLIEKFNEMGRWAKTGFHNQARRKRDELRRLLPVTVTASHKTTLREGKEYHGNQQFVDDGWVYAGM